MVETEGKRTDDDVKRALFEVRPGFRQLQILLFLGILAIALFVGIIAAAPHIIRFGQSAFAAGITTVEWVFSWPSWIWICLSVLLGARWIMRAIEKRP